MFMQSSLASCRCMPTSRRGLSLWRRRWHRREAGPRAAGVRKKTPHADNLARSTSTSPPSPDSKACMASTTAHATLHPRGSSSAAALDSTSPAPAGARSGSCTSARPRLQAPAVEELVRAQEHVQLPVGPGGRVPEHAVAGGRDAARVAQERPAVQVLQACPGPARPEGRGAAARRRCGTRRCLLAGRASAGPCQKACTRVHAPEHAQGSS